MTLKLTVDYDGGKGVVVDHAGNVDVSATTEGVVYRISPAGEQVVVVGTQGAQQNVKGALPGGLFYPMGLTLFPSGQLVVAAGNGLYVATFE